MAIKSRYWSAIGWVESLPDDYQERLRNSNIQCVISPLHDSDIVEKTGVLKKPHYHVLLLWDGPTTFENVQEFCIQMGLGTYIERVRSVKNILDYLTHDSYSSKGKYHYDVKNIVWINCNINDFININFRQIVKYIRENKINQFSKLVDKLFDNMENDLLEYVSKNTYFVNTYISSLKFDIDKDIQQTYALLKGIADEIDARGKITMNKDQYMKVIEVFEQLSIYNLDEC